MRPLHILHILPTLTIGGAERAVVNLINASDPVRFRYTIAIFFDQRPLLSELKPGRCEVRVLLKNSKLGYEVYGQLVRLMEELKPDVVHTHLFNPDVWGRLAAKRCGLPVVTTEHNINTNDGWVRNFFRFLLRNYTDRYVACSESVAAYARKAYHITKPIDVVRWGIPLEKFSELSKVTLRAPLRLMILGRLAPQKGHEIVLQALAELVDYPWQLEIVGNGALHFSLVDLATELGIINRVRFTQATLDVPGIFECADVLLVPSRWEGLGLVAMEGLAAGRLVIASAVDGLREVITDGKTGILVPPTIEAWKIALEKLFIAPEKYQKLVQQGAAHAFKHFDIQNEVARYEEIYESLGRVVSKKSTPRRVK